MTVVAFNAEAIAFPRPPATDRSIPRFFGLYDEGTFAGYSPLDPMTGEHEWVFPVGALRILGPRGRFGTHLTDAGAKDIVDPVISRDMQVSLHAKAPTDNDKHELFYEGYRRIPVGKWHIDESMEGVVKNHFSSTLDVGFFYADVTLQAEAPTWEPPPPPPDPAKLGRILDRLLEFLAENGIEWSQLADLVHNLPGLFRSAVKDQPVDSDLARRLGDTD